MTTFGYDETYDIKNNESDERESFKTEQII